MLTYLPANLEPPEIKLPAGNAVVYPSSALHQVAQVSRGERLGQPATPAVNADLGSSCRP